MEKFIFSKTESIIGGSLKRLWTLCQHHCLLVIKGGLNWGHVQILYLYPATSKHRYLKWLNRGLTIHLHPDWGLRFGNKILKTNWERKTLSCIKFGHLLNKHTANHELNSLDWRQSLLPKLGFFPMQTRLFIIPQKVSNLFDSIKMLIKLRAHKRKHSPSLVAHQNMNMWICVYT